MRVGVDFSIFIEIWHVELRTHASYVHALEMLAATSFFYSTVAFVMYVEVYVVSYGIIQLWYDVYTRTSNEREKQQVFVSVLTSQEEVYW